MFNGKLKFSVYNIDKKEFLIKDTVQEIGKLTGFTTPEIFSKLRYCTDRTGGKYYCEKLQCNITFRKR